MKNQKLIVISDNYLTSCSDTEKIQFSCNQILFQKEYFQGKEIYSKEKKDVRGKYLTGINK